MVVEPARTRHPRWGQPINRYNFFFFEPTLEAALAAESSCPLARWLCDSWLKQDRKSGCATAAQWAEWDDLRARSDSILLAGFMNRETTKGLGDCLEVFCFDASEPHTSRGDARFVRRSDDLSLLATDGQYLQRR